MTERRVSLNPLIFREYDIRGLVGTDLTADAVELIGKGYGTFAAGRGARVIALGRDARLSSPEFRDAFVRGLLSTGLSVIDVGVCPTPLLYFAVHFLRADGGVMITGSHNPPEFNGFKLCIGLGSIYGEMIQEIRRLIESGTFQEGKGELTLREIIPDYKKFIRENLKIPGKLKIVVDGGNGTAGATAPDLFREMGMDVVELFCEADGRFPNHFPDPTIPENLRFLVEKVVETGADAGVSYDGDADRIGVVDERGNIIFGDYLLILFAREILSRKPGATIISEVKASQNLYDDIARRGGRPVMWKTGHSLIKAKIKEEAAELAGEMSGHIFFSDRYLGFDDAIYASVRLFEIMAKEKRTLGELLSDLPPVVCTPEIRKDCPDELKFRVVKNAAAIIAPLALDVVDIDGIRAMFDGGWGLVRASNTQPMLVLRFEGRDEEAVLKIRAVMEDAIARACAEAGA